MVEQRNEGGDAIHQELAQVPHGKVDERTVFWFDDYELEERGLDVNQWQAPDEGQLLALCDLPTTWIHPAAMGISTTRRTLYLQPLERGLWRLWRKEWQFGSDNTVRSVEDATKVFGGALVLSACCTGKEGDTPTRVGMFLLREWIMPTEDEDEAVFDGASPYHSIEPKLLSLNQIYSVLFSVYLNVHNRWNQPTFTKDDFDAILRETPPRLNRKVLTSFRLDSSYRVRNWKDATATEEENSETPSCDECGTALEYDEDDISSYIGFGYGCPDCLMPYCPFCQVALAEECAHVFLIADSEGGVEGSTPFANEQQLRETLAKFIICFEEVAEEDGWSTTKKKRAFGTLLPVYEAVEPNFDLGTGYALTALCEALPPVAGAKQVTFKWESAGMGYASVSGFFIDKPEEARKHYTEQAEKFIIGLNALAELEPEAK